MIEKTKIKQLAVLLADEHICAIFAGRSESGRRALGNRSILADPRSRKIKDAINEKVKHRQWFRPFAPVVLAEHVDDIFIDAEDVYMSFVARIKDRMQSKYPGITHVDGTETANSNARKTILRFIHKEIT